MNLASPMSKSHLFLGIETSTTNCSVGLFRDDTLVDKLEEDNGYSHSEKLGVFVKDLLENNKVEVVDLSAIGVGVGPGSYTGLRIGVSFVKGLGFAHNIPIIKFTSLELLLNQFRSLDYPLSSGGIIIPMLDARRDEVYCQVYNSDFEPLEAIKAEILSEESFSKYRVGNSKIICLGPGAIKSKELIKSNNMDVIENLMPSIVGMESTILSKYRNEAFENLAYFEPYYLKEFFAGKAKRSLLSPE